jgi:hypothetical protein
MSRIKRPSPALVVAILALVAAIAVPAYALTRSEKRVVRKIAKVQANKQINKRATLANEVHSPARIVLNDPTPGDTGSQSATLLAAGAFTVSAECWDNFAGSTDDAVIRLHGPAGTSFSARTTSGGGVDNNPGTTGGDVAVSSTTPGTNEVNSGDTIAVAPNGQVITVTGSAEVNDPAGDCVFDVTAVGP